MADALCGPSNALHHFQKHNQQDRTLQQDRLVSRAGPSQNFRSSPQNPGFLDPEFEAFQAGHVAPIAPIAAPSFFQQSIPRSSTPLPASSHTPVQQSAPDWALDFQRLNLSTPGPAVTQNAHQPMFSTASAAASTFTSAPAFGGSMFESSFSHGMMGSAFGSNMGMGLGMNMNMMHGHQEQQSFQAPFQAEQQQAPVFDDAAFEAAFDFAASQVDTDIATQNKFEYDALLRSDEELDAIMNESITKDAVHDQDMDVFDMYPNVHVHPYQPTFQNPEEEKPQEPLTQNEGDALAQTAGQLLDSVSNDTSDKFAQSSFLALMRRLRDREVTVDGENFIDSSTNAIANTTGQVSSTLDLAPEQDNVLGGNGPLPEVEASGES